LTVFLIQPHQRVIGCVTGASLHVIIGFITLGLTRGESGTKKGEKHGGGDR
jgi:hypothetical protein